MFLFEDVEHGYDERRVLHGISVELTERRIAVIGANGSGKSTFARLLNGLQVPTSGRVLVDGLDTRSEGRAVRRKVGFVFQDPDVQIVMPTVAEDVAFGLKHRGLSKTDTAARVAEVLAEHGLSELAERPAHLLSGGEKQRLAIASVLALEPECVVFDEPTTMLDLRNKRRTTKVIAELPHQVVVVSHDLDLLSDFDRVLVFDEGRIVEDAPPARAIPAYLDLMAPC
ncbi:energy-coupling factor ABC transporter ATP-binding protein [Allokutzneria sp. NRRL B-24872]|uniref:energy-coupling factor ABC transporter ATP-binding protein n=1 Tax=Allokutzneria sp. NRRL B-24872 TaxID=1137961 RepID=UPI000A3772A6|nr:ABC transporter ATP-binding protein [Allokutzneria sp. NRRL B-24872]